MEIRDEIIKLDFQYNGCIDYEANSIQDEGHYELCKDDYCRCSTMEFYINSIDRDIILKYFCDTFDVISNNQISQLRSICEKLQIYDFECRVCGGYYGEETDGI